MLQIYDRRAGSAEADADAQAQKILIAEFWRLTGSVSRLGVANSLASSGRNGSGKSTAAANDLRHAKSTVAQ